MLAWIVGILLIVGGLGWAFIRSFAAGMDPTGRPVGETIGYGGYFWCLAAVVLGIVIIIWG